MTTIILRSQNIEVALAMEQPVPLTSPAALGDLVRRTRKQLGMTQAELAALAGFSVEFVNHVENGKATAQLGKTLALMQQLGIRLYGSAPEIPS